MKAKKSDKLSYKSPFGKSFNGQLKGFWHNGIVACMRIHDSNPLVVREAKKRLEEAVERLAVLTGGSKASLHRALRAAALTV